MFWAPNLWIDDTHISWIVIISILYYNATVFKKKEHMIHHYTVAHSNIKLRLQRKKLRFFQYLFRRWIEVERRNNERGFNVEDKFEERREEKGLSLVIAGHKNHHWSDTMLKIQITDKQDEGVAETM
ncbi:hypothetical protein AMTRI_Chr03g43370 [Amborella trichopoda]